MSGATCATMLVIRICRKQAFTVQILIDIKKARCSLKAMVRNNKELTIGAELFQNQPKTMIQQAEIFGCTLIKRTNLRPERMLQAIGPNKGYITKIPGFFFQQVRAQLDAPLCHT